MVACSRYRWSLPVAILRNVSVPCQPNLAAVAKEAYWLRSAKWHSPRAMCDDAEILLGIFLTRRRWLLWLNVDTRDLPERADCLCEYPGRPRHPSRKPAGLSQGGVGLALRLSDRPSPVSLSRGLSEIGPVSNISFSTEQDKTFPLCKQMHHCL